MGYKAFVSSTFNDLKRHREKVICDLRQSGFSVDPMEDWTASADEPNVFSQDRVKDCDLCILLVAFRRGHIPKGYNQSITQLEYQAALKAGVDVLPFLLEEETNWPIEFNELDRDTELQSWRASLRESNLVGFFNTHPDSLNISPALSRWIQNRGKGKQEANYSDSILNGIDGFFFPNYEQPTNRVEDNISLLLDYKSRLTDFFGRNKIRKEIDNWLYQDNHRLAAVVTGVGGVGKSRLMAEICEELRASNWLAGFVVKISKRIPDIPDSINGILVVKDDAEEDIEGIDLLFDQLLSDSRITCKVRIIIISRPDKDWLSESGHYNAIKTFKFEEGRLSVENGAALFEACVERLSRIFSLPELPILRQDVVEWMERGNSLHQLPLYILAASVYSVLNGKVSLEMAGKEILEALSTLESNKINKIGIHQKLGDFTAVRLKALAAIGNGLDLDTVERLGRPEVQLYSGPYNLKDIVLRSSLWDGKSSRILPLQPDIFSAVFLKNALFKNNKNEAPKWIWEVLKTEVSHETNIQEIKSRLGRLIYDSRVVFGGNDNDLTDALKRMIQADGEDGILRAEAFEKFVAEDRPPEDLLDFFITVNEKLLLSKSSDPQVRSQRLHYYAAQLNRSGQAEEALIPAEEAVELRRLLVNNQPGLLPDLAESLYVLSISYSNSEEGKEKNNVLALETIKEAVVHAENLLDEYDPYSYIRLGRFLNSYAIDLFRQKNVGKEEFISAFSVIETSEEKHRHVLTYFSSTRGFNMNNAKGELARTLFTKGQIQRLLNEDAKAHASFLESIQFKRELVAQEPWRYEKYLGLALENEFGCRLALGLSKSEESIEEALTLRRRLKDTNYSAFAKDYFNTLAKNVLYGLQQKHTTTISQTVFARAFWEKIVEESLDEPRKFIETIQTLTELVYDSSNYFNYYLILELLDLFENNRSGDIPELFVIKSRIYIILSKYSEGIKDYNQAKDYFEKAISFDSQAHRILGNEWPIREHLFLVMELGPLCELFFLAGQNNLGIAAADYARKIYFSAPKTYVNDWIDNLRLKRRIFFINNFNDTINWLAKFKPGMTAELQEAINQLENLISQLRSPGFIWYKAHLIDSLGTSKMRIGIQNKDCSILYEAREDLSLGMQIMKDNCFNHNKIFQTHLDEVNDAIKLTCPDESVNAGL